MNKKIFLILLTSLFLIALMPSVLGVEGMVSVTIKFPQNMTYNSSSGRETIIFNTSVIWSNATNVTNVTWWFIGSNNTPFKFFVNNTVNASGSNNGSTATVQKNATQVEGWWVMNITADMLPEGKYKVISEARNVTATDSANNGTSKNSSYIEFTIDRTSPSVTVSKPNNGQMLSVKGGGFIDIDYTPSDTNIANATLYIDGQKFISSTSENIFPNITSGSVNRFTRYYDSNNNSRTLVVEITDLAGNQRNSSQFTFSIYTTGAAEAETVTVLPTGEIISGKPTKKASPTKLFSIGGIVTTVGKLLFKFWYVAGIVAVVIFIIYQNRKKN